MEPRSWHRDDVWRFPEWTSDETAPEVTELKPVCEASTAAATFWLLDPIDSSGVDLHDLQQRLLARELCWVRDRFLAECLTRAAVEALTLAWTTPYPLLFLPGLLEEKCDEARRYCAREAEIRRISAAWLDVVLPLAGS